MTLAVVGTWNIESNQTQTQNTNIINKLSKMYFFSIKWGAASSQVYPKRSFYIHNEHVYIPSVLGEDVIQTNIPLTGIAVHKMLNIQIYPW